MDNTQQNDTNVKPRKARRPTLKQQAFVKEYIANKGNGTKAAMSVYNVKNKAVANSVASENLQKPIVRSLLDSHVEEAELVLLEMIKKREIKDADKLAAVKLLLAYTKGLPVSRSENININITVEDLLSNK